MRPFENFARAVLFLAVVLPASTAHATHKIDHRFTVTGRVTYEDGAPAVRKRVSILGADEKELGLVITDDNGVYGTVLHIHDSDLGKVFDLKVKDQKMKVRVDFDPADKTTERGARVDFVIPR